MRIQRTLRIVVTILLALLTGGWIASLPLAPFESNPANRVVETDAPLITTPVAQPDWRDTLVLHLTATDLGVQQRRGFIMWSSGGRRGRLPLILLADERMHRVVIPIGAHPDWRGAIQDLRVQFPQVPGLALTINDVQFFKRTPFAIDALLARTLAPYLPEPPPWSNVVLLVATLLGASLTVVLPFSHWRRRLELFGIILGSSMGVVVIAAQVSLLATLFPLYAPLDEAATVAIAPAYDESTQVNAVLQSAAAQLPTGDIVVIGFNPESFVALRARYLFYPRRVDTVSGRPTPAQFQQLLQQKYVGVIQPHNDALPLPSGWQAVSASSAPISIARAPDLPTPAPIPIVDARALVPLLFGLTLVFLVGWGLAGLFGWRADLRLASAWAFGISVVGWWMFTLNLLGIAWSWWSIGVPLLVVVAICIAREWRNRKLSRTNFSIPRIRLSWELGGALVIIFLSACVTAQALLLPFTDQDTWTTWAFKGRAFFLDGAMQPMLTLYRQLQIHHPAYPPAQSLIQTWGYIAMSGISERLVKIIFPIWYATALALVWVTCRQWLSRIAAFGWTLLLAMTPLLLDHATLGNADLPFAVALLLSAIALSRWIETGARQWLIGGVVALGGAAWLKLDGLYLGLTILFAASLVRVLVLRRARQSFWKAALTSGVALVAFLLSVAPWMLFARSLNLHDDTPVLDFFRIARLNTISRAVGVIGEELLFSYNNSAWGWLGGGFGALWFICFGALVIGWRKLRHDPIRCYGFCCS
jgi:4-amino-4-deoxy-L-arabinose transferase-like glycosyltransferase